MSIKIFGKVIIGAASAALLLSGCATNPNFLAASGVPASRMTAIGHGSSRPAVPNDSEANRTLNGRVQLEISPTEKLKAQESGNN